MGDASGDAIRGTIADAGLDAATRRVFLKIAGAGAFVAALDAAPVALAAEPRTLTIAWDTDIDTLDPASFKSIGAYIVQTNVYDTSLTWKVAPVSGSAGLYLSPPTQYDPGIAASWSLEDNDATLVMKIRQGMTFPSGRPVTAAALKYMLDRGLQSPGYMRIILPLLLRVTKPEQFELRDDETVAVRMPAPSPFALDTMALVNNALLDPDAVKAHATPDDPWASAWLKRNTAGLGPYQLVKNDPGVEVVLQATEKYWRPAPFFDRVVFKFVPNESDRLLLLKRKAVDFVAGRSGLSPRSIKSVEGDKTLKVVSVPDTTCNWLSMNTTKAPFDKPEVRRAVNYAIPIQAIIPNVLFGYGAPMKSPVPNLTPGYDATLSPYKYDIDRAQALMKQAGLGSTPIPVDLAVRVGWQPHEEAAVWIQRELQRIGFAVNIVKETDATFRQMAIQGNHHLSIETWQSWINDPYYHLYFNFHSKAKTTNNSFYSNPDLDQILDANMFEQDTAKRMAGAKQAQKILIDDAVWGFLWYDNWTRVMRSDLVGIEKRWDTFERVYPMKLA
jgi:peptide/nickel transport system substrate-binding protein